MTKAKEVVVSNSSNLSLHSHTHDQIICNCTYNLFLKNVHTFLNNSQFRFVEWRAECGKFIKLMPK